MESRTLAQSSRLNGTTNGARGNNAARAAGLGLLGIGLGLTELTAPRAISRWLGAPDDSRTRNLLRAFGAREVVSGIGLLASPRAAAGMWARVAGDGLDLALLGLTLASPRSRRGRVLVALGAIAGIAALDVIVASRQPRSAPKLLARPIQIIKTVTIACSPSELYKFWRNLENLPRFMEHLESVTVNGERSTWRARPILGITPEWEAEITQDKLNQSIAWRSLPGAAVASRGIVRFQPAPGDRGTQLTIALEYAPPGGKYAAALSKLFGAEPGQQIGGDLRRLKQIIETGEVMRSDASIHRGKHPARPSAKPFIHGKAGAR